MVALVSDDARVLTPDLRGSGESDKHAVPPVEGSPPPPQVTRRPGIGASAPPTFSWRCLGDLLEDVEGERVTRTQGRASLDAFKELVADGMTMSGARAVMLHLKQRGSLPPPDLS